MRNVEIKAKVQNIKRLLERAKFLSGSDGEIIQQHDTFYKICQGRLKLRQFKDGNAELIFYDRPDTDGPKLSSYEKCDLTSEAVCDLSNVLSKALGMNGVVKKTRRLFLVDQTRIHVDMVDGLGDFVELEVVLRPEQTLEDGQAIANDVMKRLDIENSDLISGAYRDLLSK